jgi:carboxyl-terminal processing protease
MKKILYKHFNCIFLLLLGLIVFVLGVSVGQSTKFNRQAQNNSPDKISAAPLFGDLGNNNLPKFVDAKEVDFDLFWDVWKSLEDQYYQQQEIADSNLFYGSIRGMVAALGDPYTMFFDPKEARAFDQELQGTFEGIGAEIGIKHNRLTIIAPLPDTPAKRAGLRAGDKILAIDDVDTYNMFIDEAVRKIRGPRGSEVVLTILSKNDTSARKISIIRDKIIVRSVSWKPVENNKDLIYLRIFSFTDDTARDFKNQINAILKKNPKGIILDLRSNPGGYLDAAVRVASLWIEDGPIVQERFADDKIELYKAQGKAILKDLKTVVLVNEGSASASEIVAGALQDYKKAIIVGEQTFGKGLVQDYSSLKDGSALKITVAEWLTPQGVSINKEGITPDNVVEMTKDDYNEDKDPQMEKAVELLK